MQGRSNACSPAVSTDTTTSDALANTFTYTLIQWLHKTNRTI